MLRRVSLLAAPCALALAFGVGSPEPALLVDRALPPSNTSRAAGSTQANSRVGWSAADNVYVADHFMVGASGEVWVIDKVRVWAVPGLGPDQSETLGDLFERISLYGGLESENPPATPQAAAAECACHGPVKIAWTDLRPGSNTSADKQVLFTPVQYSDGSSYREDGRSLSIWQADFQGLHWSVPGGTNVLFGVYGAGRTGTRRQERPVWFAHASAAADKHQFRLFDTTGQPVVPTEGSALLQAQSLAFNVQVWGHLTANIAIHSQGRLWQVALLGGPAFDVRQVDAASLRFGPKEIPPADSAVEDLNGDGHPDLVLHFGASESGAQPAQLTACLQGVRTDGTPFEGCDMLAAPGKR